MKSNDKTVSIRVGSGENEFGLQPIWLSETGEVLEGLAFLQSMGPMGRLVGGGLESDRSWEGEFGNIDLADEGARERADDRVDVWHEGESFAHLDLRGTDFKGAHLRASDFSGADLSMAEFFGADLRESVMTAADLTYADLTMANLEGANLRFCDLCKANFKGASLKGATLCDSDLERAVLTEADLRGADLSRTDMRFARLDGAIVDETTILPIPLGEAKAMGVIVRTFQESHKNRARRPAHEQH